MKKLIYIFTFCFLAIGINAQNVARINVEVIDDGNSLTIRGTAVSLTGAAFEAEAYNNRILFNSSALTFNTFNNLSPLTQGNLAPPVSNATAPFNMGGGVAFDRFILFGFAEGADLAKIQVPASGDGTPVFEIIFDKIPGPAAPRGVGDDDYYVQTTTDATPFPVFMQPDGYVAPEPRGIDVGGILPVELSEFDAEKFQKTNSKLTWTTTSEINSDFFQLERTEDGRTWNAIGKVTAQGFTHDVTNYSFVDENVVSEFEAEAKTFYYRLKIVDQDRSFEYSEVRPVTFEAGLERGKMSMFPNPSSEGVTVAFENTQEKIATLQIFDVSGKNIYSENMGNGMFVNKYIDLNRFSAGTYMVFVNIDGNIKFSDKLIIQE